MNFKELTSGLSTEDLEGSGFVPSLDEPYLGDGVWSSLSTEDREVDGEIKTGMQFSFDTRSDHKKGYRHNHYEYDPTERDDDEKAMSTFKRIGYILKYWAGNEVALQAVQGATDWSSLKTNVQKVYDAAKAAGKLDKIVTMKVIGNVYQGKSKLQFPMYLGFLGDEHSTKAVAFSRKEKEMNVKYIEAEKAKLKGTDDVTIVDSEEGEAEETLVF